MLSATECFLLVRNFDHVILLQTLRQEPRYTKIEKAGFEKTFVNFRETLKELEIFQKWVNVHHNHMDASVWNNHILIQLQTQKFHVNSTAAYTT